MTNIRPLADFLKISVRTVSRALNNKPVRSTTIRKKLLDASEKAGYVPNEFGRKLRSGRSISVANLLVSKLEQLFEQNIYAKAAKVVHFEKFLRINTANVDIRMEGTFHY